MGYRRTDRECDALKRIVALLFALANLADLAAGASFLRRRRVLGILNWGETEARAFLIAMSTGEAVPAEALEPSGDLADLAVRLRALALMLILLARAAMSTLPGAGGAQAGRPLHGNVGPGVRWPESLEPPQPDTS